MDILLYTKSFDFASTTRLYHRSITLYCWQRAAMSYNVLTKNCLKNMIPKNAIIGDKSKAKGGMSRRMGSKTGSVTRCRNCTIGLNGSGLTQLIRALTRINQYITVNAIFKRYAKAFKKFPKTNMHSPFLKKS